MSTGRGDSLTTQAHRQAVSAYAAGRLAEAERLCGQILQTAPDAFDTVHLLAVVQSSRGQNESALKSYDRALALRPQDPKILTSRGLALQALGRFEEALASHEQALAISRTNAEALNNRGVALQNLMRLDDALESLDRAVKVSPDYADAHFNRSVVLQALHRYDDALASYDRVLALQPKDPDALGNRGHVFYLLKRFEEAVASYDRALAIWPNLHQVWSNRGIALRELKRYDDAVASFGRALALQPNYVFALSNRGNALQELRRYDDAIADYDRALALQPDYIDAEFNRSTALKLLGRFEDALKGYERVLALQPQHPYALSDAADCAAKICDWRRYEAFRARLCTDVHERKCFVSPFILLNYSDDEALHQLAARQYVHDQFGGISAGFQHDRSAAGGRIKIAYLSADFRSHPVAQSIVELFERHDRSRFEVVGVSFGPDDGSGLRSRITAAMDQFHDVQAKSDRDVASLLHDLKVNIAVDLCGLTTESRPAILAHRPAPVQVSYHGYLASMGSGFIDYVMADAVALPPESQARYTERIVHLPGSYFPHDTTRAVGETRATRAEMGLPERGFVFCCFNANWKITPSMFDVWMSLLKEVEGSVLWLSKANDTAVRNIRGEAEARGIDPARLIFAPRLPRDEDYLGRLRYADLFLDTLPYNAHSTALDALWAGLPVLTCKGNAFAGRVAASVLQAIGMSELVTASADEYRVLALALARDPAKLEKVRSRLIRNRETYSLFDTAQLAGNIETAYTTMWGIWRRGEKPRGFDVAGSSPI